MHSSPAPREAWDAHSPTTWPRTAGRWSWTPAAPRTRGDDRRLPAGRTRAVAGDVTDARHRADLVAAARDLGGLDLLVNNASHLGPSPQPRLADYPTAELARVYEVDVLAPHALLREALPALRRSGGVVVNVSSDAAVEAYEGWGGYGSAKAALDHLSAVLAAEEPGLRVLRAGPGRHAHRHAPGGLPGRGHLRPAGAGDGGGAGLPRRCSTGGPPSGRYRATDLLLPAGAGR